MGIQFSAYTSQTKSYVEVYEDGWSPNYCGSNGNLFLALFGMISTVDEGLCGEESILAFKLGLSRVKLELEKSISNPDVYQFELTLDNKTRVAYSPCSYLDRNLKAIEDYLNDAEKMGADTIRWS